MSSLATIQCIVESFDAQVGALLGRIKLFNDKVAAAPGVTPEERAFKTGYFAAMGDVVGYITGATTGANIGWQEQTRLRFLNCILPRWKKRARGIWTDKFGNTNKMRIRVPHA